MPAVNVFITIDVECSIGGAFNDERLKPVGSLKRVFPHFLGHEYGISLIMNIAERYGLSLIFFVDTFHQYYFGANETKKIIEPILKRGHDIQLHIHPGFRNFTLQNPGQQTYSDLCGDYSLAQQIQIIADAKDKLTSCGVPPPNAFRAGSFGANTDTLKALKLNGFIIDSSYNQSYLNKGCMFPDMQLNDLSEWCGIFEFPITQFAESSGFRKARILPLDLNGVSFEEIRYTLNASRSEMGPRNVTMLLHSFSFVKPYDLQYNRIRPRWNVIRRFERLCRFLGENAKDFPTCHFSRLSSENLLNMSADRSNHIPMMPALLSIKRFAGQLFDRCI